MAVAMLAEIPDLTREQHELVVKKVNAAGTPAGALLHAGGPIEGGYRIIEVWQSREAADAFYSSDLYRQAAAASPAQPTILMTWPIYGLDNGSGWTATT
jgi:quinol monooxygenase YgiN